MQDSTGARLTVDHLVFRDCRTPTRRRDLKSEIRALSEYYGECSDLLPFLSLLHTFRTHLEVMASYILNHLKTSRSSHGGFLLAQASQSTTKGKCIKAPCKRRPRVLEHRRFLSRLVQEEIHAAKRRAPASRYQAQLHSFRAQTLSENVVLAPCKGSRRSREVPHQTSAVKFGFTSLSVSSFNSSNVGAFISQWPRSRSCPTTIAI